MSKVYVVSDTTHNIVSAQQYGEIVTILPPNTQIAFSPAPTVRRIKRALEKFCADDYLLLIGDPSCIAIACSIATTKTKGIVKVLKWDKREHTYIHINIDLEL